MILGLCCVKDSAAWIEGVIESHLQICDRVLVLDDGSADRTGEIAQAFDNVEYWRQEGLPRNEARDRNWLFSKAHAFNPSWCWWFDGDETLWRGGRPLIEAVPAGINTVRTPLLAVWEDETKYSPRWSVEKRHLFRYLPDVCKGYAWKGHGKFGIHCGACPRTPEYQDADRVATAAGLVELHWGWSTPELARFKIERYRVWDHRFKTFEPYRKYEACAPDDVRPIAEWRPT